MDGILQDLGYAARALAKRRSYALTTVVVFALAIGANTTVFTVLDTLFLRPLPYPDGDRIVVVYSSMPKMGLEDAGASIADYVDWREQARSLQGLAMIAQESRTLEGKAQPQHIQVARASPSLLAVVGVMPEGFNFFNREIDAWVPFAYTAAEASDAQRGQSIGLSVGRLRPGATLEGLDAELDALVRRRVTQGSAEVAAFAAATGLTARARPLREYQVGDLEQMLLILQGIVLAVLLMACANITNLQLARVASRKHELSVRTALGARHWRLARLVLVESLVLAAAGAVVGLALAFGGLGLVRALGLDRSAEGFRFTPDSVVLAFTAGAAALAALISAVSPAIALVWGGVYEAGRLRWGAVHEAGRLRGGGPARQRFRSALVVVQLGITVALLVGAGLLAASFYRLQREGPGFDAAYVWTAEVALPDRRYPTPESRARFFRQALEGLRALPGVTSVGLTSALPFSGADAGATIMVDGYTPPASSAPPVARLRTVSAGYFSSLKIPILEGRGFNRSETDRVAIVDEAMTRKYWPGGDAIGRRVRIRPQDPWYTVIGVVPSVKHESLVEQRDWPTLYWHYEQRPPQGGAFTLRTSLPPERAGPAARAAISRIDPDVALYDALPMQVSVARSLGPQRTPMVLTLVFGAVAFALAIVGIYGVLTSAVTQRVREIGVRMALGAGAPDVIRMIVAQGVRLIVLGLVLGLGAAILLGRVLSSQMRYVTDFDPGVLAAVGTVLVAAALFATWLPARRASRIDPMQALREE